MNSEKKSEDKYLISLSDILLLFRRGKRKIIFCTLLLGMLGALYALTKPIKYRAEGTFREKANKSGQVGGLAQALFSEGGGVNSESEAISLMKSRKLIKEVISKLNLQGQITPKYNQEGFFSKIRSNLKIELSRLKKSPYPVLSDVRCPLSLKEVQYTGEVPLFLDIRLVDQDHYRILQNKELVGEGVFNQPYIATGYSFTIAKENADVPFVDYSIYILPMSDMSVAILKDLEIETTKNDKGILKLSYEHRNRQHASMLINTLMDVYQGFIKKRHDQMALAQMEYLFKRRDETSAELEKILVNHADAVKSELSLVGVADAEDEMEFLAKGKHQIKDQLLSIELEIKRLKEIKPTNYAFFDRYVNGGGSDIAINEILKDMRALKQERDGFEIALKNNVMFKEADLENSFKEQLVELKQVQQYKADLIEVTNQFNTELKPNFSLALLQDPRYLVKSWFHKLDEIPQGDSENQKKTKMSFKNYLENLRHLFNVHEKILQERLTHQQKSTHEYQGINPITAKTLYLDFCKLLSEEESEIKRTQFFLTHMEDPNFEISSLSSVLKDPVSMEMISKASRIVLNLKDENNQSSREQIRLKDELNLQRTFLKLHLEQTLQLMELNKKHFEEKIYALQNINLELIHQQISLLEKNFHDYVVSRLENLEQERIVIKEHLNQIHEEMATLPKRRSVEQLIEHQVEVNELIISEVAKVVESKNIANNLDVIQSAPIDESVPPVHPISPGLFTFTLLGGILGSIMGGVLSIGSALTGGVRVSLDNLKKLNQHVSGHLSGSNEFAAKGPLKDADLETLRRLQAYFDRAIPSGSYGFAKGILLIEGLGPDYSFELASLFSKKGLKVLVMDLDFNRAATSTSKGLLQYLQGELTTLPVINLTHWNHLPTGGVTRFSSELLTSSRFKDLMEKLSKEYDWILGVSHVLPISAEAESLVPLFSNVAVTIQDEKVEDLVYYTNLSDVLDKKITYIVSEGVLKGAAS